MEIQKNNKNVFIEIACSIVIVIIIISVAIGWKNVSDDKKERAELLYNITLFRETYHSVTSRFFSNNTCWKLIFAIHFISPTRLNKILFFYCIIMHYPV